MLSGRQGCESRPGTSSGVGKGQVVVGRRTPLSLVQALLPSNQEMMRQDDQRHVMVPTAPETQLTAHSTHTHKRGKRRLDGSVAETKTSILAPRPRR